MTSNSIRNYYICASEFRKGFIYFCNRSGLQGSSKLPSATDSFFADTLVTKGLRFVKNPADLPLVPGARPPENQGNTNDNNKTWIVGMCALRVYEGSQTNYVQSQHFKEIIADSSLVGGR